MKLLEDLLINSWVLERLLSIDHNQFVAQLVFDDWLHDPDKIVFDVLEIRMVWIE